MADDRHSSLPLQMNGQVSEQPDSLEEGYSICFEPQSQPANNGLSSQRVRNGVSEGDDFEVVSSSPSTEEFDPRDVFQLILSEHEAAKARLDEQKALIASQHEIAKQSITQQSLQIGELKSEVESLKLELEERDRKISMLESELKSYKATSEKNDELVAKLCRADDTIKYQEEMMRQFQTEGFVEVNPHLLTDRFLANELSQKDQELENFRVAATKMQEQIATFTESEQKLNSELEERKNLVLALENQLQLYEIEVRQLRSEFAEERIALLNEIDNLRGLDPSQASARSAQDTLTPGDRNAEARGDHYFRCTYCHVDVLSQHANDHLMTCGRFPSIIDNID